MPSGLNASTSQWQPPIAIADTNIAGYLALRKETIIIAAMEESRQQCVADIKEEMRKRMERDWEQGRKKVLEELGGFLNGSSEMEVGCRRCLRLGATSLTQAIEPSNLSSHSLGPHLSINDNLSAAASPDPQAETTINPCAPKAVG